MAADRLLIAISEDGTLRARALSGQDFVRAIATPHHPTPLAARAIGRAALSAALFPLSWKEIDLVSIQWVGRGPLGSVVADFRRGDVVRAMAKNPNAVLGTSYAGRRGIGYGLLPQGALSVIRQRENGHFDRGQVALVTGEIDEDLEEFFVRSEQQPTRLRTHVDIDDNGGLIRVATGVIVQPLPGKDDQRLPEAADLEAALAAELSLEALLDQAFMGKPWRLLETRTPVHRCTCNRERFANGLLLLDASELLEMVNEDQGAKLRCDFCATAYQFDRDELEALFAWKFAEEQRTKKSPPEAP